MYLLPDLRAAEQCVHGQVQVLAHGVVEGGANPRVQARRVDGLETTQAGEVVVRAGGEVRARPRTILTPADDARVGGDLDEVAVIDGVVVGEAVGVPASQLRANGDDLDRRDHERHGGEQGSLCAVRRGQLQCQAAGSG